MNELIVIENNKLARRLNKKKLVICIIIFLSILLICIGLIIRVIYLKNQEKQEVIKDKENQMKIIQYNEITRKIKEQEEQEKQVEKIANRNKKELTPEQMEKIENIYNYSETKMAYLTFDDGPSENVTPLILELLDKEEIKAIFFVLGVNVDIYPDILKEIRQKGHYIANHGYSHKYSEIYSSIQAILDEYNKTEESIKRALGEPEYKSNIFRFPGGSIGGRYHNIKSESKNELKENNIAYIDWNSLTGDTEGKPTKESIMENLKSTIEGKNTLVILMHDSSTKMLTYETMPEVISYLKEQGYNFGDLYELIEE